MMERQPFDLDALAKASQTGPCFICKMLAGEPAYKHHIIAEDDFFIAFLSKYPTMPGYTIVCPKNHIEDSADGLTPDDYLKLQSHVHRLSCALKQVFDAERIYVLSLGSRSGNSHIHWHVAPLPKGVPYEHQQYHALMAENGILKLPDAEMADIAARISAALAVLGD
ncbi:HIT domain-containing protein [Devosia sp. A8/3-2]|nr:HIT domain-containing protein [Devosia sp. A8/3-2]